MAVAAAIAKPSGGPPFRPPTLAQVQEVVEAGEIMPEKSTYFYPKLISGLLFNPF